jgi:hypothetical protein
MDDAFKTSSIFQGPEMSTCTGVGGCSHAFLLHKGHDTCTEYKVIVCRSCQGMIDKHVF